MMGSTSRAIAVPREIAESPEWRRLWRALLDPIQFVAEQEGARGDQPRANDAKGTSDDGADLASR